MSPLNDINPNDIERIEIVKGAASATLYGSEASAGVIHIFTKKGRTGPRPGPSRVTMASNGSNPSARGSGPISGSILAQEGVWDEELTLGKWWARRSPLLRLWEL